MTRTKREDELLELDTQLEELLFNVTVFRDSPVRKQATEIMIGSIIQQIEFVESELFAMGSTMRSRKLDDMERQAS